MKNEYKTAAAYIRVSTDNQTEYSPDSQLKLIKKYARDNDIEIIPEHVYREDGISGTKADKRPQFQKMMLAAKRKNKPFNVILVYDFSRFARNKDESVMYKTMLRKKLGIDIISITQPLSDGKESIILESMYEAMDEYYSLNLSENTIRGKIEKASRGEHQGNPPFGYTYNKNDKTIEIDDEKAKIVKMIFNDWNSGSNMKSILKKLNSLNIKTARGKMWTDRNLHIMLRNPVYAGYTRFCIGGMKRNWDNPNIKITKGNHEQIISEEDWSKAVEIMKIHDSTWYKYKKTYSKHEHWLSGIIKCGSCGSTITHCGSNKQKYTFFQCNGYVKGRCRVSHCMQTDKMINYILEQVKNDFTQKIEIDIRPKIETSDEEVNILRLQIKQLEARESRIKDAYLNGIDTLEEYKENKEKIILQMMNTKKELDAYLNSSDRKEVIQTLYKKCETAYNILNDENAPEDMKSVIAHELFNKIIYDKKNGMLKIFYK